MQRLLIYDATQHTRAPRSLGLAWQFGSYLYRGLGRIDAAYGARRFDAALRWVRRRADEHGPVTELQYWGHGKWGAVFVDRERLDRGALAPAHPLRRDLDAIRECLAPNALIWFRTCETLGANAGQDFASALGDYLGARIAGHTFVIGFYQSGLHELPPGCRADWSASEGLAVGSPGAPQRALNSAPSQPNTITCLEGRVPTQWATQQLPVR
ncbi:MAG TPA: hypothetical protein VFQ61_07680 [Polyangiaceae bacterium]|nr:hypothetical protein [Polyangiaceae bacterium]